MNRSDAEIKVEPSDIDERSHRNMAVEMISTARDSRGDGFKYNYDFGFKKMGDTLIDLKQDTYQWSAPHNVELTLVCRAERNQLVDYIDIKMDQSSNEHDAKIIEGGIGKDFIKILVTSRNTYWFKYEARFYGSPTWLRVRLEKSKD